MVLIQALTSAIFGEGIDRVVKAIQGNKPPEIQTVKVKQDPDEYSATELNKVTTGNTKWTNKDKPLAEFENILEKDSIVREISLMPDTIFRTKGKILITIDDVEVFKSKSFDAFENIQDTVVRVNKTIEHNSKVKIFMISSDGTNVSMTIQVSFGE